MGILNLLKKNNKKDNKISYIIKTKKYEIIKELKCSELYDLIIELNYNYYSKMNYEELNSEQKTLYLCMSLEDACQADSIISLRENKIMYLMPEMYEALLEIGATKTAELIKEFMELLPKKCFENKKLPDIDWFFENEKRTKQIQDIDDKIADYPDGNMKNLYQKYILKDKVIEKIL